MELACPPLETINSEYPNRDSTAVTNPVYVLSTHRGDFAGKNDLANKVLDDAPNTKRDQYPKVNNGTHISRMMSRHTTGLETEGADYKDMMNERLQTKGHELPEFSYQFLMSPKFGPKNLLKNQINQMKK